MDINTLNKKRRITLLISVSLMIVIISISVVFLVLGMTNTYFFIAAPIFLIVFLFLLSKFIVIPQYEKIKLGIVSYHLNERYKDIKIEYSKVKFSILDDFYSATSTKKEQKYRIIIGNNKYDTMLFTKKYTKNSAITFDYSGFIISTDNFIDADDFALVKQNAANSNQVINFLKDNYKNINNDVASSRKYYRYTLMYGENPVYELADLFDDFDGFNMLVKKDDKLIFIIDTKVTPISFKLQYKIEKNNLIDFKNNLSPLYKIIDIIEKRRRS